MFGRSEIDSLMILTPVFQALEKSIWHEALPENVARAQLQNDRSRVCTLVTKFHFEIKMPAASGRLEPVQQFMLFCVPAETFRNIRRPARSAGRPTTPVRAGLRARYQAYETPHPAPCHNPACPTRGTPRLQNT